MTKIPISNFNAFFMFPISGFQSFFKSSFQEGISISQFQIMGVFENLHFELKPDILTNDQKRKLIKLKIVYLHYGTTN